MILFALGLLSENHRHVAPYLAFSFTFFFIVKVIVKFIRKGITGYEWGEMEKREKHFLLPMQKMEVKTLLHVWRKFFSIQHSRFGFVGFVCLFVFLSFSIL
jgi:hypothetical protein